MIAVFDHNLQPLEPDCVYYFEKFNFISDRRWKNRNDTYYKYVECHRTESVTLDSQQSLNYNFL